MSQDNTTNNNQNSLYFDPGHSDEDEDIEDQQQQDENQTLMGNENQNNISQQDVTQNNNSNSNKSHSYNKKNKSKYYTNNGKDCIDNEPQQSIFERFCILFVFIGLLIVIFIICTILVETFKAEEMQHQQENLMKMPIIKPLVDGKQYKTLILQNNLKVLLINDPQTKLSYAAMDVNAGSWVEPKEISGLAHYLEHMLFLASETYPQTSYFDSFLSENGGYSNAYTTDLHTNFFFHINTKVFEKALSIFSHMFIDPLFVREQAEKEASNVESEYQIDVNDDGWKMQNLISLMCKPEHPMSRFTIGTVDTLIRKTEKIGIDVVESLEKFFNTNYSSNLMGLVLYSNLEIEDMEGFVNTAEFSHIKNQNLKSPNMTTYGLPFQGGNLGNIYKIQTQSGQKTMNIVYQLDGLQDEHKRGFEYIIQMINFQGENSFLDKMKQNGFLIDLSYDVIHRDAAFFVFSFQFILTDFGFKSPGLVLNCFYTFIQKIYDEGVNEELYTDLRIQSENEFNYQLSQESEGLFDEKISQIANSVNQYKLPEVLMEDYIFEDFDKMYIQQMIKNIQKIDNSVLILGCNQFFYQEQDGEQEQQSQELELALVEINEENLDGENNNQQQKLNFLQNDIIGSKLDFLMNQEDFEYVELYDLKYSQQKLSSEDFEKLGDIDQSFYQTISLAEKNRFMPQNMEMVDFCDIQKQNNIDQYNESETQTVMQDDKEQIFMGGKYVLDLLKQINQNKQNQDQDQNEEIIENNNDQVEKQGIAEQNQNPKFLGKIDDNLDQSGGEQDLDGEQTQNLDEAEQFQIYSQYYFTKFLYQPFISEKQYLNQQQQSSNDLDLENNTKRSDNFQQQQCQNMEVLFSKNNEYPQLIQENTFYKLQTGYKTPQVSLMVQLSLRDSFFQKSQLQLETPESQIKLKIIGDIMQQSLIRKMAQPLSVDYNIEVQTLFTGYTILLEGWSDKFDEFIDIFLQEFSEIDIESEQFEWARDIVMTNYMEFQELDALHQAFQVSLHQMLISPSFKYTEYIQAAQQKVNLENIVEFFEDVKSNLSIKNLIIGNILPVEANNITQKVSAFFLREDQVYQDIIVNKQDFQMKQQQNSDGEESNQVQNNTENSEKDNDSDDSEQITEIDASQSQVSQDGVQIAIDQDSNSVDEGSETDDNNDNSNDEDDGEDDNNDIEINMVQLNQQQLQIESNKDSNLEDIEFEQQQQQQNDIKIENNYLFQERKKEKIQDIRGGNSYVYREYLDGNEDNLNSATVNYYQYGTRNLKSFTQMRLLVDILNSHEYTYLRTERELGYVAFCMMVSHGCVDGFLIGVEGAKSSPQVVDEMIEQSLFSFSTKLDSLTDEEFNNIKDSVRQTLLQNKQNLNQEIKGYFEDIVQESYAFDLNAQAVKMLENIQKEDLFTIFEEIFKNNIGKISVQRFSNAQPDLVSVNDEVLQKDKSYSGIEQVLVNDIENFKTEVSKKQFECALKE